MWSLPRGRRQWRGRKLTRRRGPRVRPAPLQREAPWPARRPTGREARSSQFSPPASRPRTRVCLLGPTAAVLPSRRRPLSRCTLLTWLPTRRRRAPRWRFLMPLARSRVRLGPRKLRRRRLARGPLQRARPPLLATAGAQARRWWAFLRGMPRPRRRMAGRRSQRQRTRWTSM